MEAPMFTDRYKPCAHCGDWVDTYHHHITGTNTHGEVVYLHHDWCVDEYEHLVHVQEPHIEEIKHGHKR